MIQIPDYEINHFLAWCEEKLTREVKSYNSIRNSAKRFVLDEVKDYPEADLWDCEITPDNAPSIIMLLFHFRYDDVFMYTAYEMLHSDGKVYYTEEILNDITVRFCDHILSRRYEYGDIVRDNKLYYFKAVLIYHIAKIVMSDEFNKYLFRHGKSNYLGSALSLLIDFIVYEDDTRESNSLKYVQKFGDQSVFKLYIPELMQSHDIPESLPHREVIDRVTPEAVEIESQGKMAKIIPVRNDHDKYDHFCVAADINTIEETVDNSYTTRDEQLSREQIKWAFGCNIVFFQSKKKSIYQSLKSDKCKCFILMRPGKAGQKQYKDLTTGDNLKGLNKMSGEFLDIFYGKKADIGNEIIAKYRRVKNDELPSIYIWHKDIRKGRVISIKDLENPELISVIGHIVDELVDIEDLKQCIDIEKIVNGTNVYINDNFRRKIGMEGNNVFVFGDHNVTAGGAVTNSDNFGNNNAQDNSNQVDFEGIHEELEGLRKEVETIEGLDRTQISMLQKQIDALKGTCDKRDSGKLKEAIQNFIENLGCFGETASAKVETYLETHPKTAAFIKMAGVFFSALAAAKMQAQ